MLIFLQCILGWCVLNLADELWFDRGQKAGEGEGAVKSFPRRCLQTALSSMDCALRYCNCILHCVPLHCTTEYGLCTVHGILHATCIQYTA